MTVANLNIVTAYAGLLEGLDNGTKSKIIENLSNSLKKSGDRHDQDFFDVFGAFESDKSAEELIDDIKSSRVFRKKEIKF